MKTDSPVLATICARGGSKGIPGKNLQLLDGRPLITHTIDAARACPLVDALVVSTDSDEIASMAEACGVSVPFRRPAELATDTAAKLPAIRHAADWMQEHGDLHASIVVDLDITVPLRAPEDISACIEKLRGGTFDVVITVYESERNPYFNMVEIVDGYAALVKSPARPIIRRQDAPVVYSVTPAVFAFRRELLSRTDYIYDGRVGVVKMPRARAVDIDHDLDLAFVEFLLKRRRLQGDP